MGEALEQIRVVFPSCNQPSEVMQPANCAFDFIAANVAPERTTVLCGRLGTALAMRVDQADAADVERLTEPVGISRFVVKQPLRRFVVHTLIDECFDVVDFARRGGRRERGEGCALAIDHQHDGRALTFMTVADLGALFLPVKTSHRRLLLPS